MNLKKIFVDTRKIYQALSKAATEDDLAQNWALSQFSIAFEGREGIEIKGLLVSKGEEFQTSLVVHRLTSKVLATSCSCHEKRMCGHILALVEQLKPCLKEGSSYLLDLTSFLYQNNGESSSRETVGASRESEGELKKSLPSFFLEQVALLQEREKEPILHLSSLKIRFHFQSAAQIFVSFFIDQLSEPFSAKVIKKRLLEGDRRGRYLKLRALDGACFDFICRYLHVEEDYFSPAALLKVLQDASLKNYGNLYLEEDEEPLNFASAPLQVELKGTIEGSHITFSELFTSSGVAIEGLKLEGDDGLAIIEQHTVHLTPFPLLAPEVKLYDGLLQEGLSLSLLKYFQSLNCFFTLSLEPSETNLAQLPALKDAPFIQPHFFLTLAKGAKSSKSSAKGFFQVKVEALYGEEKVIVRSPHLPYLATYQGMRNLKEEAALLEQLSSYIAWSPNKREGQLLEERFPSFYREVLLPFKENISFSFAQEELFKVISLDQGHLTLSQKGKLNYFEIAFRLPQEEIDLPLAPLAQALQGNGLLKDDLGRILIFDKDSEPIKQNFLAQTLWMNESAVPYWSLAPLLQELNTSLLAKDTASAEAIDKIRAWQKGEKKEQLHLSAPFAQKLRTYQKEGFEWLAWLYQFDLSGVLADDMGLGKTIQTIALFDSLYQDPKRKNSKHLVVCPSSLCFNWLKEIEKFAPHLKPQVIHGDKEDRLQKIEDNDSHVLIISYALIQRDISALSALDFDYLILDEAQAIKNPKTAIATKVKGIQAKHRLALTGTPIENSPVDLWSLFDFVMPGFLAPFSAFMKAFLQLEQRPQFLQQMAQRVKPFILRRKKKDVLQDLPPIEHATCYVEMEAAQKTLYVKAVEEIVAALDKRVAQVGEMRARFHILAGLTRLKQICCHPALLEYQEVPSAKFALFLDLIEEIQEGGHRVVVFSQYVSMLKLMQEALQAKNIPYSYLDGKSRNRLSEVEHFNYNADIPVFLLSLKAGGLGLNLTGADRVIHYDLWWNPAIEDQATDRIYRIGQTKNVISYKLITKGTVEEKIVDLQGQKKQFIEILMNEQNLGHLSLSWQQIKEILCDS